MRVEHPINLNALRHIVLNMPEIYIKRESEIGRMLEVPIPESLMSITFNEHPSETQMMPRRLLFQVNRKYEWELISIL